MKYIFQRDTLFTTVALFIFILAFSSLHFNLHILDPLRSALSDIHFNDLAFSRINKEKQYDEHIVIVDIDTSKRKDIAVLLSCISKYNAAVVGLDLLFLGEGFDKDADLKLGNEITKQPKLVLATKLNYSNDTPGIQNYYGPQALHTGYVNFIGEDKGVIRSYAPFEKFKKNNYNSFTSSIIEQADQNKYRKLTERKNNVEIINFRRNVNNFLIINWLDILNNNIDTTLLRNKIVLVGIVDTTGFNIEDKYYTPSNDRFISKVVPDMNGVIIHANIISMILEDQYIHLMPKWLTLFITILLTHVYIAFFIKYYTQNHKWFHIRFKVIQLLSTILFIYVGIRLLSWNCYVDFALLLMAIVLSVDVLYFYEAFAKWLEERFSFKTVFSNSKHG